MDTTATNNSTLPLLQQQQEGIDIFDYGQGQFQSLRAVDLAISSISLASSTLVIFAYLYMFIYHRKQANRVSLRCAFLCCIADVVNDIINILLTDVIGDSDFCRASGVIIDFANIFNSALLTLVGLNLFLIFVVNVNRKDLLERFYYPGAIIYSIVGIVVLIYFQTTYNTITLYSQTNCWYLTYIVDRTSNTISWMWFYSFIFFVNIVAIICSASAMIKLLHEQILLNKQLSSIAAISSHKRASQQISDSVRKRQQIVFKKVISRCIIYPLFPFLANIFGFILQIIITTSDAKPGLGLVMLDVVFSDIEGFFVAIVFFTDPAVTSLIGESYRKHYQKYVAEYTLVAVSSNEKEILKASIDELPTSIASPPPVVSPTTSPASLPPHTIIKQQPAASLIPNKHSKTIPMRRIDIKSPNSKSNRQYHHQPISSISPAITRNNNPHHHLLFDTSISLVNNDAVDTTSSPTLLIPYKYPQFAKCIHFIMTCLFAAKKSQQSYNNSSNSSTDTDYSSGEEEEDNFITKKSNNFGNINQKIVIISFPAIDDEEEAKQQQIENKKVYHFSPPKEKPSHFSTRHF